MKKIGKLILRIVRHIGLFFDKWLITPITKLILKIMSFGNGIIKSFDRISSKKSTLLITSLLLALIFSVKLSIYEIICLIIMAIGVIMLSVIENKKDIKVALKKITVAAIVFPLIYCLIDGLGTFLDAVYLDHLEIIDEDMALISYEFTFLLYGIISYIILRAKKVKVRIKEEKTRLSAAIFETLGQFTYVFAISSHSVITAPIVACYSALSVLLSRIFLKEKISKLQYLALFLIFFSIIMLAILEEA